ncbi:Y-family DNA polymerase [uncultured Thiodictyon sp.]|uniref:Y-family DNA polymerase n=1 Tax=uncultured Thiodictyon sp. TaxID=1846217 RepID=UPI00260115C7|nr:Y-family DNA polymerase [uncultured Thiodictyon sp.]
MTPPAPSGPLFALVDCNNFYASCERLFAPCLEGRPVVVLSNNDGCIIARSNEAKALGISMGARYFKHAEQLRQAGVAVFSSNYALYGDLSRRVMQVLAGFAPRVEVYSIDECFLDLAGVHPEPTAYGLEIARTVRQWTGIPVAVGIAPTKTLAKLANRLAKKGCSPAGPVLDWSRLPDPAAVLATVPVEDVWGIAAGFGGRLRQIGIADALALSLADPRRLRQRFGVVVERVGWELRGRSCLPLECVAPPRQQVMVSRSFGAGVSDLEELRAAVTAFASRAGEKLRAQGLCAPALTVFVQTSPFDTARPCYANALTVSFATPTQDSGTLIRHATQGVGRLFRPGDAYRKAGVLLPDVIPAAQVPTDLFASPTDDERSRDRMAMLDAVNRRYGRDTLRFAGQLVGTHWRRRAERQSMASTTRWGALPTVRAG